MTHFEKGFMSKLADAKDIVKGVAQSMPSLKAMKREMMLRGASVAKAAPAAAAKTTFSAAGQQAMKQTTPGSIWRRAMSKP